MGWASYFEDIQKVRDNLLRLSSDIKKTTISEGTARERLGDLHRACTSLYKTMTQLAEIATDPNVEVAQRYFFERTRVEELDIQIENLKYQITKLEKEAHRRESEFDSQIRAKNRQVSELNAEVKRYKDDNRSLRDDLKNFAIRAKFTVQVLRH